MVPKPMRPTSKVPRFMCFTGVLPFPSSLGMSLVYCSVWDNPAEGTLGTTNCLTGQSSDVLSGSRRSGCTQL
jgi:hypothetical protein